MHSEEKVFIIYNDDLLLRTEEAIMTLQHSVVWIVSIASRCRAVSRVDAEGFVVSQGKEERARRRKGERKNVW